MDPLVSWVVISVVVERLVEVISKMFPILNHLKLKLLEAKLVLALVIGLLLSFGASLDFFSMFGIEFKILYVGEIISAIFIAAGSNYVHDLISYISVKRKELNIENKLEEIKNELEETKKMVSKDLYSSLNKNIDILKREIIELKK